MVIKSPTKIFKSGNSSAVRISKDVMEAAGLKVDDKVNVTFNSHDGSVVIKAANTDKKFHDHFSDILDKSLDEDQAVLDFLKDK
ncbi:AbrB/MazE/SpoVT family DNA-binding domain-containing protein [Limosilactobacillus sp.]|uniref:AbrB/MazE/SpoVT family DNA-binding domain-containing protein n=1 Tax=Limosilactobacillus sp. TaxID=2773925 RepID=UPI003F11D773